MKASILILLLINTIYANNAYNEKGKIDMHGGKKDSLSSGSFMSQGQEVKSLKELSIKEPKNIKEIKDLKIEEKKEKRN